MTSISVLINTYNYKCYIIEAIESILSQSLPATEIIVVDDGSTDGTDELLQEKFAGHPLVQIITQRNGGQMAAFVAGLERATGDLIFFLDADDKYQPHHVEAVAGTYEAHPGVDFVFTAYQRFGADNHIRRYAPTTQNMGFSVAGALCARLWVGSVTSTLSLRRRLALTLLPCLRRVAPRWTIRADDALIYGSSLAGAQKYFLSEPTVLYRVHDANGYFRRKMSGSDYYAHTLRVESYIGVLCEHLGINSGFQLHPEIEFRSIEKPTTFLYRYYCSIIWKLRISLMERIRMRFLLFLHFRNLYGFIKSRAAKR